MRKRIFNSHVLVGLHAIFLVSIGFMLINGIYEDNVYNTLVLKVTDAEMTQQEAALSLLHTTHLLLKPRHKIWDSADLGIKTLLLKSAYDNLSAPTGACGSFAGVLARALQHYGTDVRLVQMKSGKEYGVHILLEANVNNRWVVLDPFYDLAFVRRDGQLASFSDVMHNWKYFKKQVPDNYDMRYAYKGARYTNWNKIPVLLPLLKSILTYLIGEDRVETLSLRAYLLNVYKVWAVSLLLFYIPLIILTVIFIKKGTGN